MEQSTNFNSLKVKPIPYKIVGGKYRKRKLFSCVLEKMTKDTNIIQYREVFAGSASIAFEIMRNPDSVPFIWLNDLDPGTANYWQVLKDFPELLKEYIQQQPISKEYFLSFYNSVKGVSTIPYDDLDKIDYALKRMIIQKLSFGAYGLKGGNPIKNLKERWSASKLCESIDTYSDLMRNHIVQVTNLDFEHVIRDTTLPSVLYLDPVYYMKGNSLYEYGMCDADHERLSRLLYHSRNPWLLSYDDCPFIRNLYKWANIKVLNYGEYSNRRHLPGQKELLITKKTFK